MAPPEPEQIHEIVIVRRRGGDDHDDHHGGVWKVAFADFMTAMMAFFLVLWIVNSTTKQTRSSLARYFNPIRLSDTTPARKGLNDPREVDFDASSESSPKVEDQPEKSKAQFNGSVNETAPSPDTAGGRSAQMENTSEQRLAGNERARSESFDAFPGMRQKGRTGPSSRGREAADMKNEAKELQSRIDSLVGDEGAGDLGQALTVKQEAEGILISLTDRADMGAFSLGSSEPDAKLVRVLAAVATALGARPGTVVVRGHTDSRPYRGGKSDNWRLSFSRAQAAFLGLTQGGLDEKRIERVEGHADRRPRDPAHPNSPDNRRIEILLRPAAP